MSTEDLAEWLRRQLARREWRAADLSRESGIATSRISDWLNRKRLPSPESCFRLAEALNVDPDDVLALAGHRVPTRPLPPDDPRTEIWAKLNRINPLPDRLKTIDLILDTYLETDRGSQKNALVHAA